MPAKRPRRNPTLSDTGTKWSLNSCDAWAASYRPPKETDSVSSWRRVVSSGATALSILQPMDRTELRLHFERLDAAVSTSRASSPDRGYF